MRLLLRDRCFVRVRLQVTPKPRSVSRHAASTTLRVVPSPAPLTLRPGGRAAFRLSTGPCIAGGAAGKLEGILAVADRVFGGNGLSLTVCVAQERNRLASNEVRQSEMKAMRNFELPGRSMAAGKNGMAATSHSTATLTAVEILKSGGNAVDAAVAACAVQCVVESGSTGIGGDCFALFSRGGSEDIIAYNGSGRTPSAATAEWYAERGVETIERHSPHAVTIPGAVEAWTRLVADHGKLPLAALLAPAIDLARDGYAISPRIAFDIANQSDLLKLDPTARRTFLRGDRAPEVGSIQRQPELAETLEAIGREGPDAFYRGAIAEDMVGYLNSLGGLHSLDDFAAAKGEYVEPIKAEFRGRTVYECPPNGQGIIALMILKILARFKVRPDPLDLDNLHIEIEAARTCLCGPRRLPGRSGDKGYSRRLSAVRSARRRARGEDRSFPRDREPPRLRIPPSTKTPSISRSSTRTATPSVSSIRSSIPTAAGW